MNRFFVYIALINLFDLLAVLSGKMWSLTHKAIFLVLCSLGFAVAGLFFALSLQYEGAAITNVLWIAISVALVALAGYFIFHESISVWQWAGMGVVLAGIVLLNKS